MYEIIFILKECGSVFKFGTFGNNKIKFQQKLVGSVGKRGSLAVIKEALHCELARNKGLLNLLELSRPS